MGTSPDELRNIATLLPFIANGTLEGEERQRVEAALAEDAALRADAEALERLRAAMRAGAEAPVADELGLARLMRQIDRQPRRWSSGPVLGAIAAAFVLGIGLSALVTNLRPAGEATYVQSAAPGGTPGLIVAFRPEATVGEIDALLLDLGAEITGGPSAIGLYEIAATNEQDLAALAERMRQSADVIESADLSE